MWRLVDIEFTNPSWNMAFEEAIMRSVGMDDIPNTLRLWRNYKTVVIGRSQCPSYEVNLKNCLRHRVNIIRRFTGGGTVYHDQGNLNYALSVKNSLPILKNNIYEAFRLVGSSVADGVKKIGLNAAFQPKNSIETNGRKISGIAGLWGKACFVHGTLLVSSSLKVLHDVLNPIISQSTERRVRSVRKRVTTISKELNKEVDISMVKDAIKNAIEQTFGVEIVEATLTRREENLAKELYYNKYSKMEWNLDPCRHCPNRMIDEQIFRLLTYK